MRKLFLPVLFMFNLLFVAYGQLLNETLIDGLDNTSTDPTYQISVENPPSYIELSQNASDKQEGASSLQFKAAIGEFHPWGSYAQIIKRIPEGEPLEDWSINDSLAIWIKVLNAPVYPEYMVFRIHLADQPDPTQPIEEYIYEHATILDASTGWIHLKLSLKERYTDGTVVPNDSGFVMFPTTWGGGTYNNHKLDYDKIVGWNFGAITSGYTTPNLPADSLTFLLDGFKRYGLKAIPAIIFNGMVISSNCSPFTWGQSALSVETGAGYDPGTNALKWIQGDEWGSGWTGAGFNVSPSFNLAGAWQQDSLKVKIKAETGVGAMRVQFESPVGKIGTVFTPNADNQWHQYIFPLREMVFQDGSTAFDSSNVTVFQFMAEATGIAGKVVYLTDVWTGNPEFDVIPPPPPEGLVGAPGAFLNTLTWNDVPGESGETYNVYYSLSPITDPNSSEVVKTKIGENLQSVDHLLRAPVTNQDVTYYYAIICTDAAGNESQLAQYPGTLTNTAKGVATISLNAPAGFTADGGLSEWSGITPIHMAPSDGSGFVATGGVISGDDDLSLNIYMAVDNTYLYVAFDVTDDIVSFNPAISSWLNDAPDLFIGLYDWHGYPHPGYKRGEEPDYHFRFGKDRLFLDGAPYDSILVPGTEYYWAEKLPSGYVIESRIPLQNLATKLGDNLFVPEDGIRTPLDFSINDADATGEREGILCYSPYNEDKSYQTPERWLYTWVGTQWFVGVEDNSNLALTYGLLQNYPNPFNPTTQINYSIEKSGMVSLKIYDLLGRLVTTLVNQEQNPGTYTVNFDASNLTSGVYFYQIDAGSFRSVKKMMLVK